MRLDLCSWLDVDEYLKTRSAIIIPTGSTEQHGPMGLIGTDALCAQTIARRAGEKAGVLVAPTFAYTPAPFNLAFPGTASLSEATFVALVTDVLDSFVSQGFRSIYFLNGHGANIAPLNEVANGKQATGALRFRIRSWWEFEPVNRLREEYYGDWEGMHATPSEIAITQASHRVLSPGSASEPPRKLSKAYIKAHAGDKHGAPDDHRREFPDGRVGSHSALATPQHGETLLETAVAALIDDVQCWIDECDQ